MGVFIGRAAEQTGVKVPTIRYYESIGLIPAPPRSEGNQRRYDRTARDRLRFIAHARAMGFPMIPRPMKPIIALPMMTSPISCWDAQRAR